MHAERRLNSPILTARENNEGVTKERNEKRVWIKSTGRLSASVDRFLGAFSHSIFWNWHLNFPYWKFPDLGFIRII